MTIKSYWLAIVCLLSFFGLSACDKERKLDSSIEFLLDNPTDATLSVSIDNTIHVLKPNSGKEVTLNAGKHTLTSPATGKIDFIVYANMPGGIINPTFNPYVIYAEVYALDDEASKRFAPGSREIEIDGVSFEGPLQRHDGLFIEDNWTYGVYEEFPDEIAVYGEQKGNIKNKIFNQKDFIRYFEEITHSQGEFAKLATKSPPAKAHYPVNEPLPVFHNAKMENAAKAIKSLHQRYLVEVKPAEQFRLSKSYGDSLKPIMNLMMEKDINLDQHDREAYNLLVNRTTSVMGVSARAIPNQ